MSTNEIFLEEICSNPTDVDVKHVYADWLIEQGDPRGNFIAHQIELSQMTGLENNYPELLASANKLQFTHQKEWLADSLDLIELDPVNYGKVKINDVYNAEFKDGFLDQITITPEQVDVVWPKLIEMEPIAGPELIISEALPEEAVSLKAPADWRSLKVSPEGWVTAYTISNVLNWEFKQLEYLDLSGCDLGESGAKLIAGEDTDLADYFDDFKKPPPISNKLRHLLLKSTNIGDEGVQTILKWKGAKNLQTLDLGQCHLASEESYKLLTKLKKLTSLSLDGNEGEYLVALKGWTGLSKLEYLALPQTIAPETFEALFPKPSKNLRRLEIASAKELAANPSAIMKASKNLVELNLGSTSLGDKNFIALLESGVLDKIVDLRLNKCSLSEKAIDALVVSNLDRLVTLDISSNKLSDKSVQQLADWSGLRNVTYLRTRNNRKLTSDGFRALVEAEQFEPCVLDVGKCKEAKTAKQLSERFGEAVSF